MEAPIRVPDELDPTTGSPAPLPPAPWLAAISALRREVQVCAEQLDAVRDCLANRAFLREEEFLACLHRRRFEDVRALHGLGVCANLEAAFGAAAFCIGSLAGSQAVRACSCASSVVHRDAVETLSMLAKRPAVYVCGGLADGGQAALQSVDRLGPNPDPSTGAAASFGPLASWFPSVPMAQARTYPCAAAVRGLVFVCGGWVDSRPARSVERLDPSTGRWTTAPRMLEARCGAAAGVLGGQLYVCGGFESNGQALSSTEVLDPGGGPCEGDGTAGGWLPSASLRSPRGFAAVCAVGRWLCAIGGDDNQQPLKSVEMLRAGAASWTPAAPMNSRRSGAAAAAVRSHLCSRGGMVLACGGHERRFVLNTVEAHHPAADAVGTWVVMPPMTEARAWAAAVTVCGHVLVLGGRNGDGRCVPTGERFCPAERCWQALPPQDIGREGAAAAACWK